MIYGNLFGAFYWKLPMGIKDTNFGRLLPENTLEIRKVEYIDMFVGSHIYLR